MSIAEFHNKAMDIANEAFAMKNIGKLDIAISKYIEAFELEKKAAITAYTQSIGEPTISILLRSAASLAMNCNKYEEAEKLLCLAISGNPPYEIAEEIRDLLETINFSRHLRLKGIQLSDNEIQMSISGNGVGFGISKYEDISDRIHTFGKLVYRTAERKLGRAFRGSGNIPKEIKLNYETYISTPRAASFALTMKFGNIKQPSLFDKTNEIIDDIVANISLVENGDFDGLKKNIPDNTYLKNFVLLTKELAPDGDDVSQVGFTIVRDNIQIDTQIKTPKKHISNSANSILSSLDINQNTGDRIELSGTLSGARKGQKNIWLKTDKGEKKISVPDSMDDIVRNFWDKHVKIVGVKKSDNLIELLEIE